MGLIATRPAREPVDRGEALADAADDRDAGLAQMSDVRAVHDARPGVQQVMRLDAAAPRRPREMSR